MKLKINWQDAASAVLVVCAVIVAAIVVRREFLPPAQDAPRPVAGWEPLAGRTPDVGPASAAIRIVLFSDYACPYCRDLDVKFGELVRRYPGKLAIVRYEYPLQEAHPAARGGAIAAKCAASQGVRSQFQSRLFSSDLSSVGTDYRALASTTGVPDLRAFEDCMVHGNAARDVDTDIAAGNRFGIDGVPAFIVDGELYSGTPEMCELEALVSEWL